MHINHTHHDDHDKPLPAILADIAARERLSRRMALRRLGGAGMLLSPLGWAAVGCGDAVEGESLLSTTPAVTSCSVIPTETGGPYPGDGTNGPNVLALSGIVRSDMRSSFGSAGTNVAAGVPLTQTIKLVNTNSSCASLAGYAIYLWHCTQNGLYSMYSSGVTGENFLRGVQQTDANGSVTFTTIVPGCYSGRVTHMHFEIYRTLAAAATTGASALKTSQLTYDHALLTAFYAAAGSGYSASVSNHANSSPTSDNVFSDGYSTQLATLTGSVAGGYSSTLTVGIAA
jgi:protocatechuate 3,4-dioxygenase beta subunit